MANVLLQDLFRKYLDETLTSEEILQLYEMISAGDDTEVLNELLKETLHDPAYAVRGADYDKEEVLSSILEKIEESEATNVSPAKVVPIYRRYWLGWTAALILILTGGVYWFIHQRETPNIAIAERKVIGPDAAPGKTGAILTLSNGKQVELDSARNGSLAEQGNARLVKQGGQLSYKKEGNDQAEMVYNIVTTPRGRQFQLSLADGTKVWLNAASSIKFPTVFTDKERRVEVRGEIYFEVAPNSKQPFLVVVDKVQTIEVLGTAFNVNAYEDEASIRTTLLQGSVRVRARRQSQGLQTGQQASVEKDGEIQLVKEPNLEAVMAWKNGLFQFDNSDIQSVMRQLARWYNMDVEYRGQPTTDFFGGDIQRNLPLSKVLRILEKSQVHFSIEQGKIIVMP